MKSIKDINTLKESLNTYINSEIRESLGIIILSIFEKESIYFWNELIGCLPIKYLNYLIKKPNKYSYC